MCTLFSLTLDGVPSSALEYVYVRMCLKIKRDGVRRGGKFDRLHHSYIKFDRSFVSLTRFMENGEGLDRRMGQTESKNKIDFYTGLMGRVFFLVLIRSERGKRIET